VWGVLLLAWGGSGAGAAEGWASGQAGAGEDRTLAGRSAPASRAAEAAPTPTGGGENGTAEAQSASNPALDRDRYISLEEIQPGMRGYGLTVFRGTAPERFELEVVAVVKNYGPKLNAFLVRVQDERFEVAKMVAGVSGSPVYLDGRLAGAMAFGWQLSEEPLYGVTPIAEMLRVRRSAEKRGERRAAGGGAALERKYYENLMRDDLFTREQLAAWVARTPLGGAGAWGAGAGVALPAAVTVSGLSAAGLSTLREWLPGLTAELGPSGGSGEPTETGPTAEGVTLRPGAVLAVPLIQGDLQAQVLGTATEVVGDEVFAFGHAWRGEGAARWPMATGYVHTFVNRMDRSFKLGQAREVVGALRADEATGVYGRLGESAPLTPAEVRVEWPDGGTETFHMRLARDAETAGVLATLAVGGSLLQRGSLPRKHCLTYEVEMQFDGVAPLRFSNFSSGTQGLDLGNEIVQTLTLLLNNPWREVELTSVRADVRIMKEDRMALLRSVALTRRVYLPGELVEARVELEPELAPVQEAAISLRLPEDLPEGKYTVEIGDATAHQRQLQTNQPQRFQVFSAEDVQRALQERLALRRDELYMSLVLPEGGLALEDQALPRLPGSRAMLLTDPSRRMISAEFHPLLVSRQATGYQVVGAEHVEIEVRRD